MGPRRWQRIGWTVFILVAGLRLFYCFQLPVNTNDILRHSLYGLEVLNRGLAAGVSVDERAWFLRRFAASDADRLLGAQTPR